MLHPAVAGALAAENPEMYRPRRPSVRIRLQETWESSNRLRYVIVIIGASFSEGLGVDEEDRFSDVLERILNERHPIDRRFEVINLSLVGNTLGNLAYYLRNIGL